MNNTHAAEGEAAEVDGRVDLRDNRFNYNPVRDRIFGIYPNEIFDAVYCTQIRGIGNVKFRRSGYTLSCRRRKMNYESES